MEALPQAEPLEVASSETQTPPQTVTSSRSLKVRTLPSPALEADPVTPVNSSGFLDSSFF